MISLRLVSVKARRQHRAFETRELDELVYVETRGMIVVWDKMLILQTRGIEHVGWSHAI